MKINLNYYVPATEFDGPCRADICTRNANAANAYINTLETLDASQFIWRLPSGNTIQTFLTNWDSPSIKEEMKKFGGITRYGYTFSIDQGGGAVKVVAKLANNQISTSNVANMIKAIDKLRPHPDGDSLYNPDFGLTKIGRSDDYPGGSLIALNPYGRIEPTLDFDRPNVERFIQLAKFGGLIAAALFLISKTKSDKSQPI
jgi:hypothetical protein